MDDLRHYIVFRDGIILPVIDCAEAYLTALENDEDESTENRNWWVEWHWYGDDGLPLAGGEWPCGC